MRSIVTYDKSEKTIKCDNVDNIPKFCSDCIKDSNKKCKGYYERLFAEKVEGIHTCPYGFASYFIRNNIYTSIVLKNGNYGKLKSSIEIKKQKITDFQSYTETQLTDLINDLEQYILENIKLRDCMHGLRNIGGCFFAMTEKIEKNYAETIDSDDDMKALISLYELVNYQLNIFEGINKADNKRIKQKIHPLFRKLTIMLSYQARKKDIKLVLDPNQNNQLTLSKNIYLAMFILLENAIKHSPFKQEVSISFTETNEYTMVTISNIGAKIEIDEKEKITERGYRGKNTISKGTGLGLSLAKEIITNHDYEFMIETIDINDDLSVFNVKIKFVI